jgi:hypothetical protein
MCIYFKFRTLPSIPTHTRKKKHCIFYTQVIKDDLLYLCIWQKLEMPGQCHKNPPIIIT